MYCTAPGLTSSQWPPWPVMWNVMKLRRKSWWKSSCMVVRSLVAVAAAIGRGTRCMPDSGRLQTAADPKTMANSRESVADSGRSHLMAADPKTQTRVKMEMRMMRMRHKPCRVSAGKAECLDKSGD